MPLHDDYAANLEAAKDFEDFVFDTMLHERRLIVGGYRSKRYQTSHGESMTGVEVKHDMKFREKRNLFIEIMERANIREDYKPAGIYHETDPWLIVVGDYSTFWVFATQTLRNIHAQAICREVDNRTNTGRGFLLPLEKADRHKAWKWEGTDGR
jgi:hypothetical protein